MHGMNELDPKSLREAAVSWLVENPYTEDGTTHFEDFMSEPWQKYIQRMVTVFFVEF